MTSPRYFPNVDDIVASSPVIVGDDDRLAPYPAGDG